MSKPWSVFSYRLMCTRFTKWSEWICRFILGGQEFDQFDDFARSCYSEIIQSRNCESSAPADSCHQDLCNEWCGLTNWSSEVKNLTSLAILLVFSILRSSEVEISTCHCLRAHVTRIYIPIGVDWQPDHRRSGALPDWWLIFFSWSLDHLKLKSWSPLSADLYRLEFFFLLSLGLPPLFVLASICENIAQLSLLSSIFMLFLRLTDFMASWVLSTVLVPSSKFFVSAGAGLIFFSSFMLFVFPRFLHCL